MPSDFTTFLFAHFWIFTLVAIWTIPWKGVALWRAARNRSIGWFVVLLIINTLGILEIIYIFAFSKKTTPPDLVAKVEKTKKPEKIFLDIKREVDKNRKSI